MRDWRLFIDVLYMPRQSFSSILPNHSTTPKVHKLGGAGEWGVRQKYRDATWFFFFFDIEILISIIFYFWVVQTHDGKFATGLRCWYTKQHQKYTPVSEFSTRTCQGYSTLSSWLLQLPPNRPTSQDATNSLQIIQKYVGYLIFNGSMYSHTSPFLSLLQPVTLRVRHNTLTITFVAVKNMGPASLQFIVQPCA